MKTSTKAFQLSLATITLSVNFMAWSMLSPLASRYGKELALSSTRTSILVSMPIIIGSLGRVLLGAMTDRFGGRKMFLACTAFTIIPELWLAESVGYNSLLAGGLLLGLSGATFAIGIPFVNAWYPPRRRGFALGVYGMGNLGVAASALLVPRIDDTINRSSVYRSMTVLILVFWIFANRTLHDPPDWRSSRKSLFSGLSSVIGRRSTLDLGLVYMLSFGAFVALAAYMPILLRNVYGLSVTDAAARAAGFVLIATLARPAGGWLSDRVGGVRVIRLSLSFVCLLALYTSIQPPLGIAAAAGFLGLAAALGCANGAVFAQLSRQTPPELVGSAGGLVGAMGGLGGLLPPVIMGGSYQLSHSYSLALILFSVAALTALVYSCRSRFALAGRIG